MGLQIQTKFGGVNVEAAKGSEQSGMSVTQQQSEKTPNWGLGLRRSEPGKVLDLEMEL